MKKKVFPQNIFICAAILCNIMTQFLEPSNVPHIGFSELKIEAL